MPKMTSAQENVDGLLQYFKDNDITLEGIAVKVGIRGSGDAVGVVALEDLPAGKVVARIPREAVLSRRTTAIGDILEEHELMGGISVALALMYERSKGDASPFQLYLQSLPYEEPTLFAWSDEDLELLKGTELFDVIKQDKELLREDYETLVKPILEQHANAFLEDGGHFTFEAFKAASSIIASRAFQIDSFHGDSLVPLADAFNHLTGAEHVHLENDTSVCPICGDSWPCPQHAMDEDEAESEAGEESADSEAEFGEPARPNKRTRGADSEVGRAKEAKEDTGVLDPISDDEEAHGHAHVRGENCHHSDASVDEDAKEPEHVHGINCHHSDDGSDGEDDLIMDMRLIRPVRKGEEVFNTYGEHSNASLLHKYGFVDSKPGENPFDVVTLSLETVKEVATSLFPGVSVDDRVELWSSVHADFKAFFAEDMDEDGMEDPEDGIEDTFFRVDAEGQPESMLPALLGIIAADAKVFKGWKTGLTPSEKMKKAIVAAALSSIEKPSAKIAEVLGEIAKARLAQYPTTLNEDRKLYKAAAEQSRGFQALTVQISEKMILERMVVAASKPQDNETPPADKKKRSR